MAAGEKKRKRTSIVAPEKRSLEAYFAVQVRFTLLSMAFFYFLKCIWLELSSNYVSTQPRPSGEKIAAIAEKLDLKKNVVRVSRNLSPSRNCEKFMDLCWPKTLMMLRKMMLE